MTSIDEQERAQRSAEVLFASDHAARHLGIELKDIGPGRAQLQMRVLQNMLNGHASCHGGFLFTLGDAAFAFACNSFNQVAVASSASIEFLSPAYLDDLLTAEASMQYQGGRSGLYDVLISNERGERIALFRGRSQRLRDTLFDESVNSQTP